MEIKNKRQAGQVEFFTAVLDNGVELHSLVIRDGSKGKWVAPPSRAYDDKDGVKKYAPYMTIPQSVQDKIVAAYEGEAYTSGINTADTDEIPF